jgi:hypothetical protein
MRPFPHPRFLALGLLILLAPPATAQSEWRQAPREPAFEVAEDRFDYLASRDLAAGRDWIEAEFRLDAAQLRFDYASTEPASPAQAGLDVEFVALHEFVDGDGDGAYGVGDLAVQRFSVPDAAGATLETRTYDPVRYEAVASYPLPPAAQESPVGLRADQTPPGRLELRFTFAPEARTVPDGPALAPTEIRYTVAVFDFPYRRNDTLLALETRLVATGEPLTGPRELGAQAAPYEVWHRWTGEARADGQTRPVEAVVVDERPDAREAAPAAWSAYYALPRARTVEFDPLLGVSQAAPPSSALPVLPEVLGDARLYLVALALGGLVVGAATLARLRRA